MSDHQIFEVLSQDTGIPVDDFQSAHGIPEPVPDMHTLEEAWEMYRNTSHGSEGKTLALEKALSFVTTFEEALKVYNNTPHGSEVKTSAFKKALSFATTRAEALRVYNNTPHDSETEAVALRKMVEIEKAS